jgi:two-component system sensor histidine kinase AtoS
MAIQVAHEIRNPLGAIQLFMGMLQKGLTGDDLKLANDVVAGLRSIEAITANLLSLARPITPSFAEVDLISLLDDVVAYSIYAMEENGIELVKDYPDSGLICYADSEQLKQVAFNLTLNAIQAMPEGGSLRIVASEIRNVIRIEFHDSGCGIDKENLDKIFNPFFTTKNSGTGLGLYTVDRIVRAHDAIVKVSSERGVGTSFIVELPKVVSDDGR